MPGTVTGFPSTTVVRGTAVIFGVDPHTVNDGDCNGFSAGSFAHALARNRSSMPLRSRYNTGSESV
jgi:uncharacterized cupin superfamily protein